MPEPFIINACLTGMVPTREMNAALPTTPEEVARDVEACLGLGVSIFHLHARDDDGRPDWTAKANSRFLAAAREAGGDALLCVSTSGRDVSELDKRAACLEAEPRPDMASLTLGSINFLRDATLNSPATIAALADRMRRTGVVPELEIFGLGMARTAARLLADGTLSSPAYANILLGNAASADATPEDLAALIRHLPTETVRCVGGIGRAQLPANVLGILYADGVRVGLEDNLYMDSDKTPATNVDLVRRVVEIGRLLGKRPATVAETRQRLGL